MDKNESKKSFVIYLDYEDKFSMLTDEQLGKLFRVIMQYEKTQQNPTLTELEPIVQMAFAFIKGNLDRDRAKYNASVNNGKKGGRPKKKETKNNLDEPIENLNDICNMLSVTDTVTDTVSVNDSVISSFEKEFARPLSPIEMQSIIELKDNHSNELISLALSESIKNGVRNLRYIERILQNWKQSGIKTIDDARVSIEKFSKSGKQSIVQEFKQEEDNLSEEERLAMIEKIKNRGKE